MDMKKPEKRLHNVLDHTPGRIRYLTYWLEWPDGSEPWVDCVPFVHPLSFELRNTVFMKNPMAPETLAYDILRKGEGMWTDKNGVLHRITIENQKRARRWGTNKVHTPKPELFLTK